MSSFKDELNRNTKTPIQAINDQWEKRKQQIYYSAESDYKNIKSALLLKAQSGQYIPVENKKRIIYKYDSKFLSGCVSRHENMRFAFLSGRPIIDSVNYKIKNQQEYDYYISSLQNLARIDGMSIIPIFISVWYQKENKVTLPYTFYKDCVIGHKLNSHLECSIEY